MGIKPKFTKNDVQKRFAAFLDVIRKRQIKRLQYLGEKCVTKARMIPPEQGFNDQTGNARSSIGYVVFADGKPVCENYEVTKEGEIGIRAGKALAEKVISGYPQETVGLVVTAGMFYCVYLEAQGRDVLTSAELLAKKELPKMLEKLISNIQKASE